MTDRPVNAKVRVPQGVAGLAQTGVRTLRPRTERALRWAAAALASPRGPPSAQWFPINSRSEKKKAISRAAFSSESEAWIAFRSFDSA